MRKGLLGSMAALLAGAGLGLAQAPSASQPASYSGGTVFRAQYDDQRDNAFDPGPPTPPHDNAFKADECETCDHRALVWVNLEYLLWMVRQDNVPPLLTTSTTGTTAILGAPGTAVLKGSGPVITDGRNGARVTIGGWLDQCVGCPVGVEFTGFTLGNRTGRSAVSSDSTGSPVLARPFINALTGAESNYFISAPGQFAGTYRMSYSSALNGVELNAIWQPGDYKEWPDVIIGFRYMGLNEDLGVGQTSTLLAGGLSGFPGGVILRQGTVLTVIDTFSVANSFYGGQVGLRGQYDMDRFFVNGFAKVAAGVNEQTTRIAGSSAARTPAGVLLTHSGGLLAVASNSRDSTTDEFSIVPEIGVNLGFQITKHIDIHAGYSFLYWSHVIRPGEFVDRRVNPTQVPTSIQFGPAVGPALPSSTVDQKDFWVQGLNAGMTFRY